MAFSHNHKATDRCIDKKGKPALNRAYGILLYRQEHCPGDYPPVDFTLEEWYDIWRPIWYKHFPDLIWHDDKPKPSCRVRRKSEMGIKLKRRPARPVKINGVDYVGIAEASEALSVGDHTVRNRIVSTTEKWGEWKWADEA